MPAVTANDNRIPTSVTAYVRELRAAFKAWLAARLAYRRRMAELRRLDERELTDLGIGRRDLDAIARGTYRR